MKAKKQEQQEQDKSEGINLAIRLNGEQYEKLKKAAEKSGKQVSTWIREISLTTAGDTRQLEELLKAVCTYIDE
jgi:predicted DNA-binding protein